jgi:hypothetical protein
MTGCCFARRSANQARDVLLARRFARLDFTHALRARGFLPARLERAVDTGSGLIGRLYASAK